MGRAFVEDSQDHFRGAQITTDTSKFVRMTGEPPRLIFQGPSLSLASIRLPPASCVAISHQNLCTYPAPTRKLCLPQCPSRLPLV